MSNFPFSFSVSKIRFKRLTHVEQRNLRLGLLFVSPWLIGFLLWTLVPIASSLYFSFTRYTVLQPPTFIGLRNYINLASDEQYLLVVKNTLWWVILAAPGGVLSAYLIANLLNTKIVFRPLFRALFFFPSIVPAIVTTTVWLFLLNLQWGAFNSVLKALGMQTIPFISNPDWVKPTIIGIHIWAQGGAMVIFLAALQDVPRELYEAATVDGASGWSKFWHVTIPMTSPVILFNLVLAFIAAFQQFDLPWLLTQGGPNKATEFYAVYLYRTAFLDLRMGKAAAMAWILFVVILIFTFILFRTSRRWVYYGGGDQ
ncbi:MAG: sugar ABC transporter permease [Chloroflexi bacterium]|nr:sugar ABC transporter permease [Chloroflexota bacterium]